MLRDEIAKIIDEGFHPDYLGDCCCEYDGDIMVGKILALPIDDVVTIGDVLRMWENGDLVFKELHPELPALVELQRKAGLWDKVKEIAECSKYHVCPDDCPETIFCHEHLLNGDCDFAKELVDALEGQS